MKDRLRRLGLSLKIIRSNINLVKLEGRKQSHFIRCPRFPSDPDARIGARRNRRDPNREEKIFGYDAIFGRCLSLIYILKSLSLASPHQGMLIRDLTFHLLWNRSKSIIQRLIPKLLL